MSQSSLVSICETNLNDQFKPSVRDNRDRNSQEETTSSPTRWNKTKQQNRDRSRVVCKTFREDMSCPASARNIPTNNKRRAKASWQDDDIDITCHQKHMPNQLRHCFLKSLCTAHEESVHCIPALCCSSVLFFRKNRVKSCHSEARDRKSLFLGNFARVERRKKEVSFFFFKRERPVFQLLQPSFLLFSSFSFFFLLFWV